MEKDTLWPLNKSPFRVKVFAKSHVYRAPHVSRAYWLAYLAETQYDPREDCLVRGGVKIKIKREAEESLALLRAADVSATDCQEKQEARPAFRNWP